jgi:hypothetical protein
MLFASDSIIPRSVSLCKQRSVTCTLSFARDCTSLLLCISAGSLDRPQKRPAIQVASRLVVPWAGCTEP